MKIIIKNYLYSAVICFCCFTSFGQQNKTGEEQSRAVDSLFTLYKADQTDSSKVMHLLFLSEEFRKTGDFEKGLLHSKKALQLAKSIPFEKGHGLFQ